MEELLLLSTIAVLGTLIALKFKGVFHKIISIGLTISILFVWLSAWIGREYYNFSMTGIMIFLFVAPLLLAIATIIYGLTVKQLNKLEKISITTTGVFFTIFGISNLMHFPFAEQIRLLMIVPIIITLTTFIKGRKITREMSFMLFWLFYATLIFILLPHLSIMDVKINIFDVPKLIFPILGILFSFVSCFISIGYMKKVDSVLVIYDKLLDELPEKYKRSHIDKTYIKGSFKIKRSYIICYSMFLLLLILCIILIIAEIK